MCANSFFLIDAFAAHLIRKRKFLATQRRGHCLIDMPTPLLIASLVIRPLPPSIVTLVTFALPKTVLPTLRIQRLMQIARYILGVPTERACGRAAAAAAGLETVDEGRRIVRRQHLFAQALAAAKCQHEHAADNQVRAAHGSTMPSRRSLSAHKAHGLVLQAPLASARRNAGMSASRR